MLCKPGHACGLVLLRVGASGGKVGRRFDVHSVASFHTLELSISSSTLSIRVTRGESVSLTIDRIPSSSPPVGQILRDAGMIALALRRESPRTREGTRTRADRRRTTCNGTPPTLSPASRTSTRKPFSAGLAATRRTVQHQLRHGGARRRACASECASRCAGGCVSGCVGGCVSGCPRHVAGLFLRDRLLRLFLIAPQFFKLRSEIAQETLMGGILFNGFFPIGNEAH